MSPPSEVARRVEEEDAEDLFVLDVRNEDDYEEWRISGSTNGPVDERMEYDHSMLESHLDELPEDEETVVVLTSHSDDYESATPTSPRLSTDSGPFRYLNAFDCARVQERSPDQWELWTGRRDLGRHQNGNPLTEVGTVDAERKPSDDPIS